MSRPILITVPKVQSIAPSDISSLSGSSDDTLDEFLVRGKKRRLDHLSWEEKVQRKKLKNRVAAQTSRDRKKAKMEDMEMKINYLTEQNSSLNSRYLKMKEQKELADKRNAELERQIAELNKRLQEKETNLQTSQPNGNGIGCAPNTTGSAAGYGSTVNTTISQCEKGEKDSSTSRWSVENNCTMPSLQDLLEEFDPRHLEELAESLLANVTTDLEEGDARSRNVVTEGLSTPKRMPQSMVGTTTKFMESSQSGSIKPVTETQQEISQINIPVISTPSPIADNLKQINPLVDDTANTFYGTYDEATNSITIVMSDGDHKIKEEDILIDNIIEEVEDTTSSNDETEFQPSYIQNMKLLSPLPHLSSPAYSSSSSTIYSQPMKSPMSDTTLTASDCGYESMDSPMHIDEMPITSSLDDLWNSTMSELFPGLA